jgi:hypothetical protein
MPAACVKVSFLEKPMNLSVAAWEQWVAYWEAGNAESLGFIPKSIEYADEY